MSHRKTLAGLFISLSLAACADSPVLEPALAPVEAPATSLTSAEPLVVPELTRHLVVFRGQAPADFEAQVASLGGTVVMNHRIGVAIVDGLNATTAGTLSTRVRAQYVEESPEFLLTEPQGVSLSSEPEPASPTDPTTAVGYFRQWNMRQVNADAAWAAGRLGSSSVTIAILDTGIDDLLPDMQGRVDLSRSISFEPIDDLYAAYYWPGRHPSIDLHFHGTNVATQAASNAWLYAGVTSQATLMSVKVCSFLGGCHGVFPGILHAIDNGADVINMSLGGWFSKAAFPGAVSAFNRIMNYANQHGVTVVVSAGNDSNDLDTHKNIAIKDELGDIVDRVHIPSIFSTYCDATHVICVSATRSENEPASYTNYGRSAIDVAAPGGDSQTGDWVYSSCPQTSLLFNCYTNYNGFFRIGVTGTSQAAPHVSGLAALAVEDVGRNPGRVAAYIRQSADSFAGGNSAYYGKGQINVARAVGAQ